MTSFHLARQRVADGERNDPEIVQHVLQEGELHFQRMLECVRGVVARNLRQRERDGGGFAIEQDLAQRRRKRAHGRQRKAAYRHPVRRPKQHDAADRRAPGGKPGVSRAPDRARIDVTGMRHDDRLGHREPPAGRQRCVREMRAHVGRERGWRSRVEQAGNGCGAYVGHSMAPDHIS